MVERIELNRTIKVIMKKILPLLFICLFFATAIKAQQKPNVVLPDVNKLMSMTPAEREAYKKQMLNQASKQAKEISQQYQRQLLLLLFLDNCIFQY